ncbi:DUF2909 family protein [Crenobacter luteus]|uniref:DUF2909 domain-containing protein n=1 Tax=Crenobacter luteus TaxID=1452487 RepID=A0A165FHH9_9NEIS|nr:DUF2909 family protein [Crenobacter luteus]KZE33294.1 hypothetical protein AVW16_09020 [Crenobacter luteus]TCP13615.1 DUF2909 family protein [Crenobacter luteus]
MQALTGLLLLAIVITLFWGLAGVIRGRPGSTRAVRTLTLRVGLSLGLFVLLLVGMLSGWWAPHAL